MSNILDAIEQVKSRELEGSQRLGKAREEAALLVARADEEGRQEQQRLLQEARQESERLLEAGSAEVAGIRRQSEAGTREVLQRLEHTSDEQVRQAVDRLLELFRREYGPEGRGA